MAVEAYPAPSVLIHGTHDRAVPLQSGLRLAELVGARVVTVDADAHALPLTHPDLVAEHVFG